MSVSKKEMKIEFAPGAFDNFSGTQEELEAFITELKNMIKSGEFFEVAEEALKIAEMLIKSNSVDLIVIDSVAALVPRAEVEGEIGDAHVLGRSQRTRETEIDHPKAAVARAALEHGAIFVNDVTALRADPELAGVADLDSVFGVGRDGGQHRQLVDEGGRERAGDRGSLQSSAFHGDCSNQFALMFLQVDH